MVLPGYIEGAIMNNTGGRDMKATRWMATILFLLVALNGCTDNRQSFFIRFIGIPSEGECTVAGDRSAAFVTSGYMDVGAATTYFIVPVVENALESSTPLNPLTAESNRVTVTGAQVRLSTETGDTLGGGDFFVPFSTTIDPGNLAPLGFTAIPPGYLTGVTPGQMVIIEMKILGITGGALEIDTPWFSFPVYTCYGCSSDWGDAGWDTTRACWDCTGVQAAAGSDPCLPGQDDWVVECCFENTPFCLDYRCP
jgi:hypothetical protein